MLTDPLKSEEMQIIQKSENQYRSLELEVSPSTWYKMLVGKLEILN